MEGEQRENLHGRRWQAEASSGEEIFLHTADEICESGVPANGNGRLRHGNRGAKSAELDDFAEFYVVEDFHSEAAVGAAGYVDGTPDHLEGTDANIGARSWIGDGLRLNGELKGHAEERNQDAVPEGGHFYVTKEREMVEAIFLDKSDTATKGVRL